MDKYIRSIRGVNTAVLTIQACYVDKYIRSIRGVNTAVLTTGLLCGQVYSEHQRGQHRGSNYRPVMWTSIFGASEGSTQRF